MKKIVLLFSFTFTFTFTLLAQTFNSPESVEFDAANSRWIVGNNGAGTLVYFYPATASTVQFASGLATGPHGIEIMGTNVYVCDGAYIRGYDLATGANNFNLNCGATFLNGLTTDGSTYLFASDFTAKKIYRINPSANAYNIMCSTAKTPNGMYYDGANNRLVFVTWGSSAPIQAVSLADSTVSTLTSTTLSNCDGITRDNAGYWYVTNWGANSLYRFTPTFTSPTSVMSGLNGPADIDINTAGDSIGIPNSNGTTVVFYTGITTDVQENNSGAEISLYPNPTSGPINVTLPDHFSDGTYEVVNFWGDVVRKGNFVGSSFQLDLPSSPGTSYLLRVTDAEGKFTYTKQFLIGK
ncbi:MAG TPA: T9SS type A sorting domain-containing protein [Bacteroidia bacterium]|jgi:streptogramin lyase|nr:T9SS type A sorting domain-containing protein [Bacteroidia bacterium]